MTHTVELKAKVREATGKTSHRLARSGKVPAVVYGPSFDAMSLELEAKVVDRLLQETTIGSTLVDLSIEGRSKPIDVIVKEVKRDPIKGLVQHVDLWAVNLASAVQTSVPITFVGTSEGERGGGVVMRALHELRVEARPRDLPEHVEVDITSLGFGDSLSVGDVAAPEGVTFIEDPGTVLVSIMAPALAEEEEAAAEVTEVPEVGKESAGLEE